MAVNGADSGTCTNEASPCRTLGYSMKQMQGGDTLYIGDGTYTGSGNQIWQFQVPPSGTAAAPTVIRAKNIPGQNGIAADQPLKVKFTDGNAFNVQGPGDSTYRPPKYVKFWGIRWNGIATYTGWDHIIFKQCASQGVSDGNSAAITIGGSYNLLEDVVAFGKGRYKFLFYDFGYAGASDNLCRRCIVRQDWAMRDDTSPLPIAGYSSYYNRRTAFLNSMVIDSDNPAYWNGAPTELAGAFYQPNDTGPHALTIKGSMVINTALPALYVASNSSGHVVSDFAAVKVAGGLGAQGQMSVNRATLLDVGSNQFSYRSSTQKSRLLAPDVGVTNWTGTAVTLTNTLLKGISGSGISGGSISNDYIAASGITGSPYSTAPRNYYTGNPLTEGLMYPVRIEAGSALSTRGSGGGQVGARIVNKLGVDGTFKGEAGWDVEQAEPLWPWPLEAWVRAEMRAMDVAIDGDSMPDPKRGFCADGQTLTNYVWGYLGNAAPALSDDKTPPSVSFQSPVNAATVSGAASIAVNASDNIGVSKVELYVNGALDSTKTAAPYSFSWNTMALTNGSYTLLAKAYDASSNVSSSQLSVTVSNVADTVSPTASVSSPANGTVVKGVVNLSATATDNAAVQKVEFYLNGALYAVAGSSPYMVSWNTATYQNGTYELLVKAYDYAGNVGQSAKVALTVNNPVAIAKTNWKLKYVDSEELIGEDGAAANALDGDTATIWHTKWYNGNAVMPHEIQIDLGGSFALDGFGYLPRQDADVNGAIGQYEFYVSSDGTNWSTAVATGTFGSSKDLKQVSFTAKTGRYIRLRALSEIYGNPWTAVAEIYAYGATAAATDLTAPAVSISSPATGSTVSGNSVTVSSTASDNTSVSKVEFYVNGTLKATDTASPFSFTWDTTAVANGSYTLTARAYDAANNVGESAAVSVTVNNPVPDTTAPVVSISSPANSASVTGTVSVAASASDSVGVTKVEFYVNGVLKATDTAAPYAYTWDTAALANGSYTLTARAYDAAGNVGQSATVTVSVSRVTPIPVVKGDVNGDGLVTIEDAIVSLKAVADPALITPVISSQGDVAPLDAITGKPVGDSKVDISDVLVMLRRVVGQVTW